MFPSIVVFAILFTLEDFFFFFDALYFFGDFSDFGLFFWSNDWGTLMLLLMLMLAPRLMHRSVFEVPLLLCIVHAHSYIRNLFLLFGLLSDLFSRSYLRFRRLNTLILFMFHLKIN